MALVTEAPKRSNYDVVIVGGAMYGSSVSWFLADNPDFAYLRALSDRSRENSRKTHLSLNESVRIAEKDADDAWRLALENDLRMAKGETKVESLDALEELRKEEADAEVEDDDALLIESGEILLDYLGLTRQIALVESVSSTAVQ